MNPLTAGLPMKRLDRTLSLRIYELLSWPPARYGKKPDEQIHYYDPPQRYNCRESLFPPPQLRLQETLISCAGRFEQKAALGRRDESWSTRLSRLEAQAPPR